jgi:flagellar motor switch/type III secretory pathway protein FliN
VSAKPPPTPDRADRYRGFESTPIRITVLVGSTRMSVNRLSSLALGDVVPLDRAVGAPFDLKAGDLELGKVEPVAAEERVALKLVSCPEDVEDHAGAGDGAH